MNKKSKLLKKSIDDLLNLPQVKTASIGGICENNIAFWTIEEETWTIHGEAKKIQSIMLRYLIWNNECGWITDLGISEMEGPALLNCPIHFFQYPVDPETIFEEWRYEVKKFHEEIGPKTQNKKVGKRLIKAIEKREV